MSWDVLLLYVVGQIDLFSIAFNIVVLTNSQLLCRLSTVLIELIDFKVIVKDEAAKSTICW